MVLCITRWVRVEASWLFIKVQSTLVRHGPRQVVLSQGMGAESRIDPELEFRRAKQRNHANALFDQPSNGYPTG